jgi:hypothetical protein
MNCRLFLFQSDEEILLLLLSNSFLEKITRHENISIPFSLFCSSTDCILR